MQDIPEAIDLEHCTYQDMGLSSNLAVDKSS